MGAPMPRRPPRSGSRLALRMFLFTTSQIADRSRYLRRKVLNLNRGHGAALEELIRTWEPRLLYFLRRLVRDEADAWDVLQETWMKVVKGISSLSDPQSLAPWLYRVARNTAHSHTRSREPPHEALEAHPE